MRSRLDVEAEGSPKGMGKRGGLDVEAEKRHEKVQKGQASAADWTLKQKDGTRKSKREE